MRHGRRSHTHTVYTLRGRPVAATDTEMTEPGSRYIDFLIPGLLVNEKRPRLHHPTQIVFEDEMGS
jgi:hypothetical protein